MPTIAQPFDLMGWIDDHPEAFTPPVMNNQFYKEADDVIVFVSKGPNTRNDYHVNPTEELFYQLKGDIAVRVRPLDDSPPRDVVIREPGVRGEITDRKGVVLARNVRNYELVFNLEEIENAWNLQWKENVAEADAIGAVTLELTNRLLATCKCSPGRFGAKPGPVASLERDTIDRLVPR